jgi:hypothetical protein
MGDLAIVDRGRPGGGFWGVCSAFRLDADLRNLRRALAASFGGRGPVSVDEFLCADDDGQREPVGIIGAWFGRVDRDANVVAGVDEGVAVEGDVTYSRVVDGLVP